MLLDYAARLHPLVIHFPIALLIVAALCETWTLWRPNTALTATTRLLLAAGAVGAIVAALSGWFLADQTRRPPELRTALEWHRWLGVATVLAVGVACAATWQPVAPSPFWRRLRAALIIGAALLVSLAGHYGGTLVWGLDYFAP